MGLRISGALAVLLGQAAAAQAPEAPASTAADPIVVTGQRDRERQVRDFVDALALPSANDQLGRAEDGICPKSFGLSERHGELLARRMRRLAEAAGVPTAADECRPNILVMVVPDKKQAIEHWRLKRPDFFDGLLRRDIEALADGEGPVAAWQIVHRKGVGRRPIGQDTMAVGGGINTYEVVDHVSPGRIGTRIQLEFFAAFVVIEASALRGASVTQVADYAAMRTFASTDPTAAVSQRLPTILSLFEPGREASAPLSVTHWDLSFLKALYGTQTAYRARDQQRAIARSVREHMGQARDAAGE